MSGKMLFFVFTSLFIVALLLLMEVYLIKVDYANKKYIKYTLTLGIITILCYLSFVLAQENKAAQLLQGIYFASIDWLVLAMLVFTIVFTGNIIKLKTVKNCFAVIALIDSVFLVLNCRYNNVFTVTRLRTKTGFLYWSDTFFLPYYVHLIFCYIMMAIAFLLLIQKAVSVPTVYKRKYTSIIIAYALVAVVNCICYTIGTPIDVSVFMYGILGGYIVYYTVFSVQIELLIRFLEDCNAVMDEGIVFFDENKVCIYTNKKAEHLFNIISDSNYEKLYKYVDEHVNYMEDTRWTDVFTVDNEEKHFLFVFKSVIKSNIHIGYILGFVDKTEENIKLQKEKYIMTHDSLTGVYNREGFLREASRIFKNRGNDDMYMLCTNIRGMKVINTILGREVGDQLLKRQVRVVQELALEDAVIGRIGGDKFAIMVKQNSFDEEVLKRAFARMREPLGDGNYELNVNVGIYKAKETDENVQVLYDKAKLALECAGTNYENAIVYYDDSIMEKTVFEKETVGEFEKALSDNQFCMFLQPQVDSDNNIIGAEALVRWQHPGKGLVPPGMFLGVLERTELIHKLDQYIWEEAAKKIAEWNQRGIMDRYISVNVSTKDMFCMDLYEVLTKLVEKYNINPKLLKIELTETSLFSDFEKASALIDRLRKYGFNIEIDDFGNGYSSYRLLRNVEADVLKIDMDFLRRATDIKKTKIILSSIITIAKAMGMDVITEGVETKEQLIMLKDIGCDMFQGYFFSKPVPVAEFEKLCEDNMTT